MTFGLNLLKTIRPMKNAKKITGANEEENNVSVEDEAVMKEMVGVFDSQNGTPLSELFSSNYRSRWERRI